MLPYFHMLSVHKSGTQNVYTPTHKQKKKIYTFPLGGNPGKTNIIFLYLNHRLRYMFYLHRIYAPFAMIFPVA